MLSARVTSRTPSNSPTPARRSPTGGERAGSFGFDLAARRALVARDREHVARLFDAAFDRLHAFIARMVRDAHVAEDLTADTFLRIQRGLPSYQPERALRPWLFTIASNVVRDHFASRRDGAAPLEAALEPAAEGDGPTGGVERSECARAAAHAVGELSEPLRAVLLLRHHEGLSFAEIGAALGIAEDTARQRWSRALARLRVRLAEYAPSNGERP